MTYFKAIQNGTVVDVGSVFLKWNEKRKKFYICDVEEAELAEGSNGLYRDYWLKASDKEAKDASIVVIDRAEYDEIRALLEDGEEVPAPPETPKLEQITPATPGVIEDQPLTISQMREMIISQQEQIEILKEKIQEMNDSLL